MNIALYIIHKHSTRCLRKRRVRVRVEELGSLLKLIVGEYFFWSYISGCRKPIVGIQRVCARTLSFPSLFFNILLLFSLAL